MSGSTPKRVSSIKKDDKAYGNIELVAGDNITIEQEDKKFTINGESADTSGLLKLDQTTPQTVDNGSPLFNEGITIKAGQKLYLDG